MRQSMAPTRRPEAQRRLDLGRLEVAPGERDAQPGGDLEVAARGDAVVMRPVLADPPGALGDVERHRAGGPAHLVSQVTVGLPEPSDGCPEGPNHLQRNLQNLECHVNLRIGPFSGPHPSEGPENEADVLSPRHTEVEPKATRAGGVPAASPLARHLRRRPSQAT